MDVSLDSQDPRPNPPTSEALVVFARCPEVGKCKTRLIPQLGRVGATEFYQRLVLHTLQWTDQWLDSAPQSVNRQVQIHFTGGSIDLIRDAFGAERCYIPQTEGDLGQRMRQAVSECFNQGFTSVCVVGTDSPSLTLVTVEAAFERLRQHDICFVPATDGGYVLIGVSRSGDQNQPVHSALSVFDGIEWSTSRVLEQSLARVSGLNLRCSLLATHSDVDEPSNLEAAERALAGGAPPSPKISVVIATLDHEPDLDAAIESCQAEGDSEVEVLVVVADIARAALRPAQRHRAQLLCAARCRASQMNAGSNAARGEILLFLHSDSRLPANWKSQVLRAVQQIQVVGGAFELEIDGQGWALRSIEFLVRARSKWLGMPYGDQGIFIRRDTFEALGKFPSVAIMEDFLLVRKMKQSGKLIICSPAVCTSARRWQQLGILRTTWRNQMVLLGYFLGVKLDRLAKYYRRPKSSNR